jgi:hypothetical protein
MVWNFGFNDGMGVTHSLLEVDGDIRKIEYVDRTIDPKAVGGIYEAGDLNLGRVIKPDNVPTKFEWGGPKNRKLPDALHGRSIVFVSDRLKEIIERFEPSVHQFFPIDIIYKSNKELAAKMFYLNICTSLDSVDHDLSTCELQNGRMWRPDKGGALVFNMDQIGNHHLWHDKHIMHGWYVSEVLKEAIVQAGITGVVFNKRKTNVEWP